MECAIQHIREAKELSRELGETDTDVKEYFFSLSPSQLRPILNAYERQYGRGAREYAEETIPEWRSGRRRMSGQNASRLFQLLPRFMPLERKYKLVEALWMKFATRSEYSVSFRSNADARTITARAIPPAAARLPRTGAARFGDHVLCPSRPRRPRIRFRDPNTLRPKASHPRPGAHHAGRQGYWCWPDGWPPASRTISGL